jgi:hypothetical protein
LLDADHGYQHAAALPFYSLEGISPPVPAGVQSRHSSLQLRGWYEVATSLDVLPESKRPLLAVSSTDGRNTLVEPFCG